MQTDSDPCAGSGETGKPTPADSLLEQIGWRGLCLVVWRSTPLGLRLIAFPYGLLVYRGLLADCNDCNSLYTLHVQKYQSSPLFKLLRPRYHIVGRVLQSLQDRGEKPHST
jgi:hypothetical protein